MEHWSAPKRAVQWVGLRAVHLALMKAALSVAAMAGQKVVCLVVLMVVQLVVKKGYLWAT